MRKLFFVAIIMGASFFLSAQGLKTPPASPPQTVKQDFGLLQLNFPIQDPE